MKIYYHDDLPGDCRLPHSSTSPPTCLSPSTLNALGVLHFALPPSSLTSAPSLERLATERNYVNRDTITVSPVALGDAYDTKITAFYEEHMHEDEEIRYILEGNGFFDVRNKDDRWIRIEVAEGDLLILPAGIYHRFTVDEGNFIKAMRLFQTEPKWKALPRGEETDENPLRKEYLGKRENELEEHEGNGELEDEVLI